MIAISGTILTDVPVAVLNDATFSIPTARGSICSGNEHGPFGIACPRRGDIASANCHPDFWSFNGGKCVAPADAKCVKVAKATWSCVFPANPRFFKEDDDPATATTTASAVRAKILSHPNNNDDEEDEFKPKEPIGLPAGA